MQNRLFFSSLLMILLLTACGGEDEELETESPIPQIFQSFIVHTAGQDYEASINEKTRQINISGLEYASDILTVEVKMAEGFDLTPNPNTLEKWEKTQTFVVSGMGKEFKYTCNLLNLSDKERINHVVMGYIRLSNKSFDAVLSTINFKHVTHVLASFALAQEDGVLDVGSLGKIDMLIKEARAAGAKVMVSVCRAGKGQFAQCVNNARARTRLVDEIISYVKAKDLDGVDIDFEDYEDIPASRSNLHAFVRELKEKKTVDCLMTCAVSPWPDYGKGYADYFDYVNVMSYDTFGGERQHAPLSKFGSHMEYVHTTTSAPYNKIVCGVPFYGYSWSTGQPVAIAYGSVIHTYGKEGAADKDQINEIYYNGRPTIRSKCRYAKLNGMAGIMIWDLLMDASIEEYKLLNIIGEEILSR